MCLRTLRLMFTGVVLLSLSNTVFAWAINEDFEGQGNGADCAPFWASNQDSTITSNQSSSGSKSCKFAVTQGSTGWGGGAVMPSFLHKGDELWIRFRLFVPAGFDYNAYSAGNHLKFIRLTARDPSGTVGRLDWYWDQEGHSQPHRVTLERDNCTSDCWQTFGGSSDGVVRGQWETYEMYAKFDHVAAKDGGQGRVRAWKNGKLIADLAGRPTMWGASSEIVSFMIFSYWNGGSPATQHLYFDDLVVTNVTPGQSDSAGNPFIGTGGFASIAPPAPPSAVH